MKRGGGGVASADGAAVSESTQIGPRRESRSSALKPAARREFADGHAVFDQDPAEVLAIDEALTRLEQEFGMTPSARARLQVAPNDTGLTGSAKSRFFQTG